MNTGAVSGMNLNLTALKTSDSGRVTGQSENSIDDNFDKVLERFTEQAADSETRDQRLKALRTTIAGMDESEVIGFLAMLENQEGWQVDQSRVVAGAIDLQAWRLQAGNDTSGHEESSVANNRILNGTGEGQTMEKAIDKAMEAALENYMPAKGEKSQAEVISFNRQPQSLFKQNDAEPLNKVSAELSDFDSAALGRMAEVKADPTSFTTPTSPNSITALAHSLSSTQARSEGTTAVVNAGQASPETLAQSTAEIRQGNWSEAMAQRLVTLVGDQRQEARIRLDPPELGSLGVRLVVEDSGVSVHFHSAIPQVREMLAAEADRLRVSLASQGLNLVDVNVGADSEEQRHSGSLPHQETLISDSIETEEEMDSIAMTRVVSIAPDLTNGSINTFA